MRFALLALLLFFFPSTGDAENQNIASREWYVWTKDDVRLYVHQLGKSSQLESPIVVLHGGLGAEHSYLLPALRPLAFRHRFTLFDQRGSLRSPAAATKITLENMVSDIEAIRTELGAEKINIITHSMGALLAYSYLEHHSENVESIVFIAPVFPFYSGVSPDAALFKALSLPSDDERYMAQVVKAYEDFSNSAEERANALIKQYHLDDGQLNGFQRTQAWKIRFASSNIFHLDRWEQMIGGQAFYNPQVFPTLVKNAGGQDGWKREWVGLFDALQRFPGKVTFIIGKNDFLDPAFQFWPLIVAKLPSARLVSFDHSGHNIWIDQPSKFEKALESAL